MSPKVGMAAAWGGFLETHARHGEALVQLDRSSSRGRRRSFLSLAVATIVVCLLAPVMLASSFSSRPTSAGVTFTRGAILRPIATNACKSSFDKPKKLTYIQCTDTGIYRMMGRNFGAAYAWLWTAKTGAPTVGEAGNFTVNLGNGVIYLSLKGTFRAIGKTTAAAGRARTTGTWRYTKGTGAWAKRSGKGTFTFDIKRNATTYLVLGLALKGAVR